MLMLPNEGDPCGSYCSIRLILWEEAAEVILLKSNSVPEESPCHVSESDDTEWIGQQHLCADRPHIPAKISRVAHQAVYPPCDQLVIGLLQAADHVREVASGGQHACLPDPFTNDDKHQPDCGNSDTLLHPW
eukprot:CAMPEP_0202915162 /NCGR_PEP_ID=MMETSP1392-20130828/64977_1 /ASSEMBLY_ACC=CAM_ASM_000868 /TAXON_ID=225041 /ORGANISM="Chlamydomonas chlamydogama, Strain SAG 11-48b" /LENGTH=131 /DNA_ID=CAMNT_0049607077 /DNA_START=459 /DNA_END=851 /DNA_ORIENTATION=-